jgi:opacity protein-like surface antigen
MKKILIGITMAAVLAAVVHAQAKLTGKWEGSTKSGSPVVLDVKATETALSGTITVDGKPATIADGKVSKNGFTFQATFDEGSARPHTEGLTGEFAGDQITIWLDQQGHSTDAVLKRVKQAALTGKWQGETRNGMQVVLDLTATGTALTGTLTREGTPSTIRDGKVSKNTFTFRAMLGDQDEGFKGELAGDQITVTLDRQGPAGAVVLKRIKK